MAEKGVKLFGLWASPFSLRVEWALKLKEVDYEFMDEDIPHNKSQELLHYNPITKKIPVLVHNGNPLAESTVIVEYVDEAWPNGYPIMPQDPFEKAQARFWARFAEDKLESTKVEMVEMQKENERLKMILAKIARDYQSLQMRFFDVFQQEQDKNNGDRTLAMTRKDHEEEEHKLLSLRLGAN
ncbi:hypothetical protein J5N97_003031 [Dioscorea zingiberensis]|uniref:Glutathione S-transferase n=1 Tax=Dioscorea zingiberensis TaxID=325984 RepID=A0A9D5HPP7_9LILI|nr:hypothetical protein J5N97_003031 [Dioscorea zingiberensis]